MTSYPKKAMILAAGLGTRLRPLTLDIPKPAVPLCGVPPLVWNLALLAQAGVEEVVINTHWRPDAIIKAVGNPERFGLTVAFSHEDEILGTGGGLKKVADHFMEDSFYLVNGKIVFDADLQQAFAFHSKQGSLATMILRTLPPNAKYRAIEIDAAGRVRRMGHCRDQGVDGELIEVWEKNYPRDRSHELTPCMFTGLHILEPGVFDYLPENVSHCIIWDGYAQMLLSGERCTGYIQRDGYFAEPSTPAQYLECALDVVSGAVDLQRFKLGGLNIFQDCYEPTEGVRVHQSARVDRSSELKAPCFIAQDVQIGADSRIGPLAVIEAGAHICRDVTIERSVIWQNTLVRAGEKLEENVASGEWRLKR